MKYLYIFVLYLFLGLKQLRSCSSSQKYSNEGSEAEFMDGNKNAISTYKITKEIEVFDDFLRKYLAEKSSKSSLINKDCEMMQKNPSNDNNTVQFPNNIDKRSTPEKNIKSYKYFSPVTPTIKPSKYAECSFKNLEHSNDANVTDGEELCGDVSTLYSELTSEQNSFSEDSLLKSPNIKRIKMCKVSCAEIYESDGKYERNKQHVINGINAFDQICNLNNIEASLNKSQSYKSVDDERESTSTDLNKINKYSPSKNYEKLVEESKSSENIIISINYVSSQTRCDNANLSDVLIKSKEKESKKKLIPLVLYHYSPINIQKSKDEILKYEQNIYEYFSFLEEDNHISFIHLINMINKEFTIRGYTLKSNSKMQMAYELFFANLIESFKLVSDNLDSEDSILSLYKIFSEFGNQVEKKFCIFDINKYTNACRKMKGYKNKLDTFLRESNLDILDWYIKILKSKNYNFLFEILPFFSLIDLKTRNENSKIKINELICLQLIFCKMEAFRLEFFKTYKEKENELIDNLYGDPYFNETLIIISIIFQKFVLLDQPNESTKILIEAFNFVNFVKLKFHKTYESQKFFQLYEKFSSDLFLFSVQAEDIHEIEDQIFKSMRLLGLYHLVEDKILSKTK
ncbi:hypothetical protein H311_02542 [Anncaliia algerae PRA109]|nr:hypothetical protein H311_02542 [Anncaliia algerae PRA109]